MPGYREAARRCELCLGEPGPDQALEPYAGMAICAGCREDHRAAARVWGLAIQADTREHKAHRGSFLVSTSEVRLPTRVDAHAVLRAEGVGGRLFGQRDPQVGADWFDRTVKIEETGGGVTMQLLADRHVQDAVVEAVWAADRVELTFEHLMLTKHADLGFKPEELDRVDRAAVALAVSIERWARGAPGATDLREGCSPAPPKKQPQPVVPTEDRPPAGPTRRSCPTCGQPMVAADLEDICTRCGVSIDVKDAAKKRRRRTVKAGLIGALVVAVLVGAFILAKAIAPPETGEVEGTVELTAAGKTEPFTPTMCIAAERIDGPRFVGVVLLADPPHTTFLRLVRADDVGRIYAVLGRRSNPHASWTEVTLRGGACSRWYGLMEHQVPIGGSRRTRDTFKWEGRLELECALPDGGGVRGRIDYSNCHRNPHLKPRRSLD